MKIAFDTITGINAGKLVKIVNDKMYIELENGKQVVYTKKSVLKKVGEKLNERSK